MKRLFGKRVLVFFFCACLLFSFVTPVLAVEVVPQSDFRIVIRVFSIDGGFSSVLTQNFGHAFVMVSNDTADSITVGHMTVSSGESITVGTFGNCSTHKGIWYNIEAHNQPTGSVSVEYELTSQQQLNTLNRTINANDAHSDITNNCAHFAAKVWNSVTPSSMNISGGSPSALCESIEELSSYDTNHRIVSQPISRIAYQTSSGITYCSAGASIH